jgi:hypothetical protein
VSLLPVIEPLVGPWRRQVEPALRAARWGVVWVGVLVVAHVARIGTDAARLGAGALLCLAVLVVAVHWRRARARWANARTALARVLGAAEPELGGRTLRALQLVEQAEVGALAGSPVLARAHFERLLAQASPEALSRAAKRTRARWQRVGYTLLGCAFLALALAPARLVEGLNVLLASDGEAPFPLAWVTSPRVVVTPPAYLRTGERFVLFGTQSEQPEGATVEVSGTPVYAERNLVLTDGTSEVPFVSDGSGRVLARYVLTGSANLRIAARFGNVLVYERESLGLAAVPDRAPQVALEGAPRTLPLQGAGRVELRYVATDDHGLRQIDLVLRSGSREDRRVLARLDGEAREERNGAALVESDPFLRQAFLPVHVTIEARDGDPVHGAKWGASAAITLTPPAVGAPEAERYAVLLAARDRLVDLLAWQLTRPAPKELKERIRQVAAELRVVGAAEPTTLSIPQAVRTFLSGQATALERPGKPGVSRQEQTENVVLALDAALDALGVRDARRVAQRLADVADEMAAGAKQARETEQRERGLTRLDTAIGVMSAGSAELVRLGVLGRDLGSVAKGDLGRVKLARGRDDLTHAELAARHLAARLRRPNPSFGSHSRRGGVESGGGQAPDAGEASAAEREFQQLSRELGDLARDHAGELGQAEAALAEAERGVDNEGSREEAKRRAEALRESAAELPSRGGDPGSARGAASLAADHMRAMAESLERLSLSDAVQSGRDAVSALDEAKRRAAAPQGPADWLTPDALEAAERRLQEQLTWAAERLQALRQSASEAARDALGKASERERELARRAGSLAQRGRESESALPNEMTQDLERAESLMQEAARELGQSRAERALELMRQAQRLLERSDPESSQGSQEADQQSSEHQPSQSSGQGLRTDGEVPDEAKNAAEDFRRRVLEGLGETSGGRYGPAVKRYAEGLLR